ncbi:hypothetical protein JCM6882_007616 [Rhodosporidiobolus microsporus]
MPDQPAAFSSPHTSASTATATPASTAAAADEEKESLPSTNPGADEEASHLPSPRPTPFFPNGGRSAYCTTAGGFLVLFSMFAISNSFGVLQAEFQHNLLSTHSPSSISWIGSVHLFILLTLGLPAGRLFDRGWFRYQLAVGSTLWIGGMFALSASKTYGQVFASYSICLGLALGITYSPTLSCVGSYFSTRRTLMMGITASGAAAGATIIPIITNHLFPRYGFAFTIRALAYIHLGCLALANVLMRPRSDLPRVTDPAPVFPLMRSFLREPQMWFAGVGEAFVMMGGFIPIFYIQVFATDNNASPVVVTYALSILNASATATRLLVGFAADRFGNITCGIPVTALLGGMIFAMLGATTTGGAVAFCVVFGAASGAWVTLMPAVLISLSTSVREFGVRCGLGFIFVASFSFLGAPVAGAILRATPDGKNYLGVAIYGGGAVLLGSGFLSAAWVCQRRRKGTWRV